MIDQQRSCLLRREIAKIIRRDPIHADLFFLQQLHDDEIQILVIAAVAVGSSRGWPG